MDRADRAAEFFRILDDWFNSPGSDPHKWLPRCPVCMGLDPDGPAHDQCRLEVPHMDEDDCK